jgi:hypothetical protein
VVAAIAAAAVVAEARMAAGALPLTAGINLFASSRARPNLPGGLLLFGTGTLPVFLHRQLGFQKSLGSTPSIEFWSFP